MKWTTDVPTEPGDYIWGVTPLVLVEIEDDMTFRWNISGRRITKVSVADCKSLWFGPIPEPASGNEGDDQ